MREGGGTRVGGGGKRARGEGQEVGGMREGGGKRAGEGGGGTRERNRVSVVFKHCGRHAH